MLPGESSEDCRTRIMISCKQEWSANTDEAIQLRHHFAQLAKEKNKQHQYTAHAGSASEIALQDQSKSDVHETLAERCGSHLQYQYVHPLRIWNGYGAMSVGDKDFGISKAILEIECDKPSFVSSVSSAWRVRAGGTVTTTDVFSRPMKLSCFEEFGFCWSSVKDPDLFRKIEKHLLRFVQDHRKRLMHKKKNMGPNAEVKQPLLVSFDGWLELKHVETTTVQQCKCIYTKRF